ncbi:hypothetical protein F5X68DRAFT_244124 [Plectosphaerella plurivora]|uniref:Uncharacterized protein n=1 Tax=Plectosphaerella plurivora TaxID=936078 RepID=A0A9P9AFN8_9PEZI|nr:hypothetical protein F5X68DRAFT_244124 [Plectosphaerella plurivora]
MSTASGSSGSQAGANDSPPNGSTVVKMLRLLDRMDDLLINSCREARTSLGNPDAFPVTSEDFEVLANAKRRYLNADYSTEEISLYLLRLATYDGIWENVCRGILRHIQHDPSRVAEWRLWLRQVERAGSKAWEKALNFACFTSTVEEGKLAMMNALIQKFAVVDEGLDEIHRELHGNGREVLFSDELRDSINAVSAISEQGGVPTAETISSFKAALRAERAAAAARWTGTQEEPAAGVPGQLRRRRLGLDRQAVEDNQDRAEGQAILPGRIEADASRQMFSGAVAYVGGVSQAFIVLEAMFLAQRAVRRDGAEERAR